MKPLSDMEELDLRCALADENKPCIFIKFLMKQGWIPERCMNKAVAKKVFYKLLRDSEDEKYHKEFE
jgi:hypothetical protein